MKGGRVKMMPDTDDIVTGKLLDKSLGRPPGGSPVREEYTIANPVHIQIERRETPSMLLVSNQVNRYMEKHGEWPKRLIVHPACPLSSIPRIYLDQEGAVMEIVVDKSLDMASMVLEG